MASLAYRAWLSLVLLAAFMAALLFGSAGTMRYWQAWVYLFLFFGLSALLTQELLRRDPALLERRMKGGPQAERRPAQRVIMVGATLAFLSLLVVWRLQDEERMLARELPGYAEYQERVRWRLLPGVW